MYAQSLRPTNEPLDIYIGQGIIQEWDGDSISPGRADGTLEGLYDDLA
jgi:hypothetical protein